MTERSYFDELLNFEELILEVHFKYFLGTPQVTVVRHTLLYTPQLRVVEHPIHQVGGCGVHRGIQKVG